MAGRGSTPLPAPNLKAFRGAAPMMEHLHQKEEFMTKRLFLPAMLAALAVCCLSACKKTGPEIAMDGAAVIFDIDFLSGDGTKAQTSAETNVNRLQVGLYNALGELEWENTYEYAFTTMKTITGLMEGSKTIVAVANKEVKMPATLEEFYSIPVLLEDNRKDAFVMSGTETAEASVDPTVTTIHLRRLVSKIRFFKPLIVSWTDGKSHDFVPEKVYIANVATKTNMKGDAFGEFINLREEPEQTKVDVLRDFTVAELDNWVSGRAFNRGVNYYVCPNGSSEHKTTLVIQARYDGQVCYYPLVVSDELLMNTMYECGTIKITCGGMPSPSDDFTNIRVSYNYESADWASGTTPDGIIFQ